MINALAAPVARCNERCRAQEDLPGHGTGHAGRGHARGGWDTPRRSPALRKDAKGSRTPTPVRRDQAVPDRHPRVLICGSFAACTSLPVPLRVGRAVRRPLAYCSPSAAFTEITRRCASRCRATPTTTSWMVPVNRNGSCTRRRGNRGLHRCRALRTLSRPDHVGIGTSATLAPSMNQRAGPLHASEATHSTRRSWWPVARTLGLG